jgi:alpha-L-fucosidase
MKARGILVGFSVANVVLAGNACSSSVNALYRDGTGGVATGGAATGGSAAGGAATGGSATADGGSPAIPGCPALTGGPAGVGPLPAPVQVAYQRTELTAFMHFGLQTFDGTEYGDSSKDTPALFNPTNLDTTQWVSALKNAGFRQATLVAKHSTGFCLWPSAFTDYSVKNSPWKSGQGDVVKEFADAARAAGLRVGLQLSPWDEHFPNSSPDYETYFRNQLTELLTKYGPIHEIGWNGYHAPTSLDWKGTVALAKQLQPDVLVWTGPEIATTGADLRYIGNQSGRALRSTSAIGDPTGGGLANTWYPAEDPVSDRGGNWFWHPNNSVMSLGDLTSIYFTSVGRNTTLLFNVPPSTSGQLDSPDVGLLQQFATWYTSLYWTNLVQGQPARADSTWASPGFEPAKAFDGDVCTYWAAASGATSARLEVTPGSAITFSVLSIREPIELGERTTAYHVEIRRNGAWNRSPTDASGATIAGTVIGQRQLWQLDATTADAIALVIDSAKDVPAIAEFGVY